MAIQNCIKSGLKNMKPEFEAVCNLLRNSKSLQSSMPLNMLRKWFKCLKSIKKIL